MTLLKFNTLTAMEEKLKDLMKNPAVKNIEFLNELASAVMALGEYNHLIVEFEGNEGILTQKEAEVLWQSREALPRTLREKGFAMTEDVFIPQENVLHFLYTLNKNGILCYGHIGIQVFHPVLKNKKQRDEIVQYAKKFGGKLGAEYGYGMLKKEYLDKESIERIKAIKAHYDPKNILNRGKVI